MTRPEYFLLATALLYLCLCLPPAASKPALLKPEGSYSRRTEEGIRVVNDLLNQFLQQVAELAGKNPTSLSAESTENTENEHVMELLPPKPSHISPVKPDQAKGPSESAPQGQDTQPAKGLVNSGFIVFPSD